MQEEKYALSGIFLVLQKRLPPPPSSCGASVEIFRKSFPQIIMFYNLLFDHKWKSSILSGKYHDQNTPPKRKGGFFLPCGWNCSEQSILMEELLRWNTYLWKKKIMAKKEAKKQELFCLLKSTTIIILNCIKKGIKQSEKSFPNTFTNTF